MSNKLNKKLQVLITEEEAHNLNIIILNDAIKNGNRPISISSFIRDLIISEIKKLNNNS
jgi:hypothetical protein